MTTTISTTNRRTNGKQWLRARIGLLVSVLILLITAAGFYFSPIGQRYAADQLSQAAVSGVDRVVIEADSRLNHVYSPAVIQIEPGTTVTWAFSEVDEDGQPVPHNVVFDHVASPVQGTGEFSVTFDEPGTYTYVCTLHRFMEGRVDVVAAD